jgi:suppressor for copper-sensitivity B
MTDTAQPARPRRRHAALFAAAMLSLAGATLDAAAEAADAASAWAATPHGAVRLISATDAVGGADRVSLGLEFKLADGWKIYWRSPGDAGYPPEIDWSGSHNLAAADIAWPAPLRFSVLGFQTVGYAGEVVLPIDARLQQPGAALRLRARVNYLTCAEICVPYLAELALDLPAGPAQASVHAELIGRHAGLVPQTDGVRGVAIEAAAVVDRGSGRQLDVVARAREPFSAPDLFVEGPAELAFDVPLVTLSDDGRVARLTLAVIGDTGLAGTPLTLTLVDGDLGVERTIVPGTLAATPAAQPPPASSLAAILLVALLGGLILNLMPCVLPVLSIKLLSVISHGGGDPGTVRLGFIATAAGIIASFLLLAAVLASLKLSGAAVGWGLQFQQPWFLVGMTLVVTLFGCNLFGLFEMPLPAAVADLGERASHVHGLGGQFLTGALATLLATPCSAPFLGTAIGFALSRGTGEILGVFLALGVGLALPYLVIAAFPRLATRLPKPGRWMLRLRRVLGLALAATGVWLVTVLAAQIGSTHALVVAAAALMLAVWFALGRRLAGGSGWPTAAVLTLVTVVAFVAGSRGSAGEPPAGADDDLWQPFQPARIAPLVAAGHTVFVNITADWCVTCRVNERLVLARPEVRARLADANVIAMQGDWTRRDDDIARYLAGFGRYGIPFDAVYGPALPEGEALPELLTATLVIDALDRARAAPAEGALRQ